MEGFLSIHILDDAHNRLAVKLKTDRHAVLWDAVHEIGCAIERIHDPQVARDVVE